MAHDLTIVFDEFGNPVEATAIAYPRRPGKEILPEQAHPKGIYTINRYINQTDGPNGYFVGVNCETQLFEIHGLQWDWEKNKGPLQEADFSPIGGASQFREFTDLPDTKSTQLEKRLVEWTRNYFRADKDPEKIDAVSAKLEQRLRLGQIETLGLPYEAYRAAITDKQLANIYGELVKQADLIDGGYHPHSNHPDDEVNAKGYWWIPSGRQSFDSKNFY